MVTTTARQRQLQSQQRREQKAAAAAAAGANMLLAAASEPAAAAAAAAAVAAAAGDAMSLAAASEPAAGAAASGDLVAAIEQRWGGEGTARYLRALAMHLLTKAPDPQLGQYTITAIEAGVFWGKNVGKEWKEAAGTKKAGGAKKVVSSSLGGGCFVTTGHKLSKGVIRLDTGALLRGREAAAAAAARNAQLLGAIRQRWDHCGYNCVLRVLAELLVQEVDPEVHTAYTMRISFAKQRIAKYIAAEWQKGPFFSGTGCPLEQLLASREDGWFFIISQVPGFGADKCVSLDTQALLAEEDGGSSSSTTTSSAAAEASPPAAAVTAAPAAPDSSSNCSTTNTCAEPTVDGMPPVQYDGMLGVMAAAKAAAMAAYWRLQAQQQVQSCM
jgi:hypothetical protein